MLPIATRRSSLSQRDYSNPAASLWRSRRGPLRTGPTSGRSAAICCRRVSLRRIHVYDSRDVAFADAEVLQENVVFLPERCDDHRSVFVTSSSSPLSSRVSGRLVPYAEVVRPDDSEQFIHLTPDVGVAAVASCGAALPATIGSLGVAVSTGRVVDFRSKEHLRAQTEADAVPLIYPTHLTDGGLSWPKDGKKPNALVRCDDTEALLLPAGHYVIVKRFSSKEERRRIVASVIREGDLPGERWTFGNHLNVIHTANHGLDPLLAIGLTIWLNSTAVDTAFPAVLWPHKSTQLIFATCDTRRWTTCTPSVKPPGHQSRHKRKSTVW